MRFVRNSHEILANFVRIHQISLNTSQAVATNFVRNSHVICTDFARISCEVRANLTEFILLSHETSYSSLPIAFTVKKFKPPCTPGLLGPTKEQTHNTATAREPDGMCKQQAQNRMTFLDTSVANFATWGGGVPHKYFKSPTRAGPKGGGWAVFVCPYIHIYICTNIIRAGYTGQDVPRSRAIQHPGSSAPPPQSWHPTSPP